ncbi:flagellar export protein FliJ [Bacillota bacterium LX-D]|nr:flagellar export protein FliJ [Bacillota bacterium LX-D]
MMKSFKFNLESVLEFKQLKEDEAKQKLTEANFKVRREEDILKGYQNKLKSAQEQTPMELTVFYAQQKDAYLSNLIEHISLQQKQLRVAQLEAECRKKEFITAHRELQTLQNLKEKRFREYTFELERIEQNLMDDLGLRSFLRKAQGFQE